MAAPIVDNKKFLIEKNTLNIIIFTIEWAGSGIPQN